ncbi:MAG: DUF177 domain-containing protein [Bacilli bacterium]|nr:DUF177 domain-containing protein [Bacilli bacterium]
MQIDISRIPLEGLNINESITYPEEYYKNTDIKKLENVNLNGYIKYDYVGNIDINLEVNGVMNLEDAITLEPCFYPFDFKIEENMTINELKEQNYYEKMQNTLDIMELLWQNIVLEVPIRVISDKNKDAKLNGDGWQLNEETKEEIDPRLAPLLELLDEGKE